MLRKVFKALQPFKAASILSTIVNHFKTMKEMAQDSKNLRVLQLKEMSLR